MFHVQIYDEERDFWSDYFTSDGVYMNGHTVLLANYYGSSSRIGKIGTLFYGDSKIIHPKSIRIIKDEIIFCRFDISYENIQNTRNNFWNQCIYAHDAFSNINAKIHLRDLHRFECYPYEISGLQLSPSH